MRAPALLLSALVLIPSSTVLALDHDLMPAPTSLTWQPGRLPIDARFQVAYTGRCDDRVRASLRRLTDAFGARLGKTLAPPASDTAKATLVVDCTESGAPIQQAEEDESYALDVTATGARVTAATSLGGIWGVETFRQIAREEQAKLVVPAVAVKDRPRFPWRGLMLDVARHFMPTEVVKRTLDGMTAVKLNVLHWHLSDDQGFRVESRRYPKLYQMGSDGLFYTQDQVRDVVAYARARGIRVLPEFDVPGHATAWLVGHPELATLPGSYAIERKWGIFDPTFDPSKEEVYSLLNGLFGELAELLPDAYFHIGGDEVTPRHWNMSPRVRLLVYEKGLKDNEALHALFNARLSQIVAAAGKKMIGWDEILHEDLPKGSVIHSWRGTASLAEAAQKGYDAILSNGYYLDHMQTAAFHYAVDPIPSGTTLGEEERRHIKGGEACMWAEYVNPEIVDSRVWPRAAAVAERLWSAADVRDVDDMYRRLEATSRRLEGRGLLHRSNYEPMLRRMLGEGVRVDALRVLADVVEPVKLYNRGRSRAYTQRTPLDRLVDAARPESDAARAFRKDVDALLASAPAFTGASALRARAQAWAANHDALDPLLARREELAELRPLSRSLSSLARLAVESLDHLERKTSPSAAARALAAQTLDAARAPLAELEIAILRSVQKLALASERVDRLSSMTPLQWNADLEQDLQPKRRMP